MPVRDVVVVGASAGGIEALQDMLRSLPADYDGAVLVVLHLPAAAGTTLAHILDRAGPLPAATAVDGEPLVGGRVYVCRADHHLLLDDGTVLVRQGPRENGHRPAIDALFRSAAYYYGPRAVGVVLSGTLSDGTAGLRAICSEGGVAIVQDPDDAMFDGMPASAIEEVGADHVVPASEIGPLLVRLGAQEVPVDPPSTDRLLQREVSVMESEGGRGTPRPVGTPSEWPCPDCDGVLWEVDDGAALRFRCRVGHAWSARSLLDAQGHATEAAL
jgi:two-component system chemotaxis response regulator CheB